jgi:Lon protease-like protein
VAVGRGTARLYRRPEIAHYPSVVSEIGLFPLALVLTPTERIPLHIFEPRYKELIGECIADNGHFGLLLEDDAGRRDVGTTASIREVVHLFDDGRMNILVEGRNRFRVTVWTEGRSFPTAQVELLEDEDTTAPDPSVSEEALELFRRLAAVADAEIDEPDGASGSLAFEIAAHVDFGTQPKQELLELRSESDRLRRLTELLEHALAAMTREKEIRQRAATNGRVSLS